MESSMRRCSGKVTRPRWGRTWAASVLAALLCSSHHGANRFWPRPHGMYICSSASSADKATWLSRTVLEGPAGGGAWASVGHTTSVMGHCARMGKHASGISHKLDTSPPTTSRETGSNAVLSLSATIKSGHQIEAGARGKMLGAY